MLETLTTTALNVIPQHMRDTALVRIFGFTKIPLLWFIMLIVAPEANG